MRRLMQAGRRMRRKRRLLTRTRRGCESVELQRNATPNVALGDLHRKTPLLREERTEDIFRAQ